jgi:hypothetical protein
MRISRAGPLGFSKDAFQAFVPSFLATHSDAFSASRRGAHARAHECFLAECASAAAKPDISATSILALSACIVLQEFPSIP